MRDMIIKRIGMNRTERCYLPERHGAGTGKMVRLTGVGTVAIGNSEDMIIKCRYIIYQTILPLTWLLSLYTIK